jgi:hypothetical protein
VIECGEGMPTSSLLHGKGLTRHPQSTSEFGIRQRNKPNSERDGQTTVFSGYVEPFHRLTCEFGDEVEVLVKV